MQREFSGILEAMVSSQRRARGGSLEKRRRSDARQPASKWLTDARIGGKVGKAMSVVLSTIGCSHARGESSGCTMCSYLLDGSADAVTSEDLVAQFSAAMASLDGIDQPISVKVYTSGSFLDTEEVSMAARTSILQSIASDSRVTEVVLESRPSFVTDESMAQVREILGERIVEIGMGLESITDRIRQLCINKGFTLEDFSSAVSKAREYGIGTRAYVLVKPPFITERDALTDSVKTMVQAAELGVTTVSVNPVNVQKHTLVESLWYAGAYRPPWLWTVVEALRTSRRIVSPNVPIVCDPVAAGKTRGAHNCGVCDAVVAECIRKFSLDQRVADLEATDCACRFLWNHVLEHEDFSMLVCPDRTPR